MSVWRCSVAFMAKNCPATNRAMRQISTTMMTLVRLDAGWFGCFLFLSAMLWVPYWYRSCLRMPM